MWCTPGPAQATCEVSAARYRLAQQLLSEQEVQNMAADAARTNVEDHYKYIADSFNNFIST